MTTLKVNKITTNKSNGYEMKNRLRFKCAINYNTAHHLPFLIKLIIFDTCVDLYNFILVYIRYTICHLSTIFVTRNQQVKYTFVKYILLLKYGPSIL